MLTSVLGISWKSGSDSWASSPSRVSFSFPLDPNVPATGLRGTVSRGRSNKPGGTGNGKKQLAHSKLKRKSVFRLNQLNTRLRWCPFWVTWCFLRVFAPTGPWWSVNWGIRCRAGLAEGREEGGGVGTGQPVLSGHGRPDGPDAPSPQINRRGINISTCERTEASTYPDRSPLVRGRLSRNEICLACKACAQTWLRASTRSLPSPPVAAGRALTRSLSFSPSGQRRRGLGHRERAQNYPEGPCSATTLLIDSRRTQSAL